MNRRKDEALEVLRQVTQDYVNDLKRQGHATAAQTLAATCSAAVQTLRGDDGTSSRQPPAPDTTQEIDDAATAD